MKVVKPMRVGVLTRPFEMGGRCYFSIGLVAYFRFGHSGNEALLPEFTLWGMVAEELGGDAIFDEGLPKTRGEVLLSARAFPPGGPAVACTVSARLGEVQKSLLVVGDRRWEDGAMTAPERFAEMPITWARAFAPGRTALPNIEDPARRVGTIDDRPPAAGFGPIDFASPLRQRLLGTYDERWQREFMPGFADDLDPAAFQQSPEDQRADGFFTGDETYSFEHLHPSVARLEGRLPSVAARCLLTLREDGVDRVVEVTPRLETVWFFPHRSTGAMVFRALIESREDDGHDVVHLLAGLEHLDAPKPFAHYESVLALRTDRKVGWGTLLRESDLLPEPRGGAVPMVTDGIDDRLVALCTPELLSRARLRRGAEERHAKMHSHLVSLGVDPSQYLAPLPEETPVPTLDELPDLVEDSQLAMDQKRVEGEHLRDDAMSAARAKAAEHGITLDFLERPVAPTGGPPRFSARSHMVMLHGQLSKATAFGHPVPALEAMLADPDFERKLIETEDRLREVYRRFAHVLPPAVPLGAGDSQSLRSRVRHRLDGGGSLAGEDLTGADLSGMDLRGADLRGAWMERASLVAADLREANLSGAVLARSDLTDARLDGARCEDLNLGEAVLRRASLERATLVGAQLGKADLRGASFRGCTLTRAELSECLADGADFSDSTAEQLLVREGSFASAVFARARWTKCVFVKCAMGRVDFSGATMVGCVLLECRAEGLQGEGAILDNLRAVSGTSLRGARLRGASMERATLRGVSLVEADLTEAKLSDSDFSEADLRGARLERIVAKDSRWVRADLAGADLRGAMLFQAILQKANIQGTMLERANLARADMARVRGRPATLDGALLTHVRVLTRGAEG